MNALAEQKRLGCYVSTTEIQRGLRGSATECPLAISLRKLLAARRVAIQCPRHEHIPVSCVVYDEFGRRWEGEVHGTARLFINSFDTGHRVMSQYFRVTLWRVCDES